MTLIQLNARVHFADGVLEEALRAEIEALGLTRLLIVTEAGVVAAGLADRVIGAAPADRHAVIFEAEGPAAAERDAAAAADLFAAEACDGVIGLGGGGAVDLAKAAALLAHQGGPLARFAGGEGGGARIRAGLPPLIAIPTTAGSGSEVAASAVVFLEDGRQASLHGAALRPTVAICDPTATLSLPPRATASSGMDAVAHCVEAYLSPAFHPPADGVALDGLARAAANIERAVECGRDRDARREMMASALNGALAFSKGLGCAHAAAVALAGAARDQAIPHGALKAVLLPHVLAFNRPAAAPRFGALSRALGDERADPPETLARLSARLGLPTRLGALGVDAEAVERAAPIAEQDRANSTNPRRATAADYREIMRTAL